MKGNNMKTIKYSLGIVILCFLLNGCKNVSLKPASVSLVASKDPIPSETMDFSLSKATLTIVRTEILLIGNLTITAAIPLYFMVSDDNPEHQAIVFGKGNGVAVLDSGAAGTGGSYTQTAEIPTEYDVKGYLIPDKVECKLILTVKETIILSKGYVLRGNPIGDVEVPGSPDTTATYPVLSFDESDPKMIVVYGSTTSVFTIEDWCLPEKTWCTYGCSAN
jgi:hypothetical protein